MQPYIFKGIHIESLKHDHEAVNILTAAYKTIALTVYANKCNKPFFMPIGKNHSQQENALHHIVTLNRFPKTSVPFDISIEHPEKEIQERILNQATKHEPASQLFNNHHLGLKQLLDTHFNHAPNKSHLRSHLYIMLAKSGTNIRFTDTPSILNQNDIETRYLDKTGPLVKALIKKKARNVRESKAPSK